MDINELRRLLASGAMAPEDMQAAGVPNELAKMLLPMATAPDVPPMQQNTMRVESGPDQGKVTSLDFNRQPAMNQGYGGQAPQMPQQQRMMQVVGAGNGTMVNLQPEAMSGRPNIDLSRSPVDIMGAKGYYSKDEPGVAYVMGPDGQPSKKVILGYDMQGSMALNKANLEQQKTQGEIAHTQEQIRASQVQNPDLSNMGGGGPTTGVTGEDFLKTLDPSVAGQVKAYAEGRLALPSGMSLKAPYFQSMLRLIGQYDPTFDVANAPARTATRKAFTSGPDAANVTAIETAINHMGGLYDAYQNLNNTRAPLWNKIANFAENTGFLPGSEKNQAATADVDSHALAVAHELASVFRRTGMSNKEVDDWLSKISTDAAPASSNQVIKSGIDLLYGRLGPLADKYNAGMGVTSEPMDLLKPGPRAVLERIQAATGLPGHQVTVAGKAIPASGSAFVNSPGQSSQSSIPSDAIAHLRQNPQLRTAFDMKYGQGASAQVLGQ